MTKTYSVVRHNGRDINLGGERTVEEIENVMVAMGFHKENKGVPTEVEPGVVEFTTVRGENG